ncbi:MAG: hypothetical protein QGG36_01165 [Pirellulaceae bacterium]|jgi:hypothetical protein|nr:hypothetical protein [Pirellulaceae bacterium]MDP7014387.1 hypothetical protein [Pirellulaceae bacterium]
MSDHSRLLAQLCPELRAIADAESALGNYLTGMYATETADGRMWDRYSLTFRFHENYVWRGTGLKKHINKDIHDWYIEYASKESQQILMCPQTRRQDVVDR